jgi:hypothetical protein
MFWFSKPNTPVFPKYQIWSSTHGVGSFMPSLPFSMIQTLLDIQILKFSLFFDLVLKLPKPDTSVFQTG